jgi:hypothetical protein
MSDVEVEVTCTGARHRLRWRAGGLGAPDHADLDAERMLVSLGGPTPRCLAAVDAAALLADDLHLLAIGPRGVSDDPVLDEQVLAAARAACRDQFDEAHRRFLAFHPEHRADVVADAARLPAHLARLELCGLPAVLQRRSASSVVATWVDRLAAGAPGAVAAVPALQAAVVGRARAAAAAWAVPGAAAPEVVSPGVAHATRWRGGARRLEVGAPWLLDVWARDLALVDGHLVLDVLRSDVRSATVAALAPGAGCAAPVELEVAWR